jgi:hypothetical protein
MNTNVVGRLSDADSEKPRMTRISREALWSAARLGAAFQSQLIHAHPFGFRSENDEQFLNQEKRK